MRYFILSNIEQITLPSCEFDLYSSSLLSCRATSTDIPDHLLPLHPIVHHFWQVLRATSCISTERLYVGLSWSPCFCSAVWGGPWENITYELVLASPAVSCMFGSSNFDSFCDGGRWLFSCCFVGCCFQDLFKIAHSILV